jgi:hypothetical protein
MDLSLPLFLFLIEAAAVGSRSSSSCSISRHPFPNRILQLSLISTSNQQISTSNQQISTSNQQRQIPTPTQAAPSPKSPSIRTISSRFHLHSCRTWRPEHRCPRAARPYGDNGSANQEPHIPSASVPCGGPPRTTSRPPAGSARGRQRQSSRRRWCASSCRERSRPRHPRRRGEEKQA